MHLLGRFRHVRMLTICGSLLLLALSTAIESASAAKPKRSKKDAPAAAVDAAEPGVFEQRIVEPLGQILNLRPPSTTELQVLPVLAASAHQPIGVPSIVPPSSFPVGEWTRSLGPVQHDLVVGPNTIRGKAVLKDGEKQFNVQLAADFSVTADGLVYGVLSDVRFDIAALPAGSENDLAQYVAIQSRLIDQPFSFRWRIVNDTLVVKDVRFAGGGLSEDDDGIDAIGRLYIAGSYERAPTIGEKQ